jgi:hypothetical protein
VMGATLGPHAPITVLRKNIGQNYSMNSSFPS